MTSIGMRRPRLERQMAVDTMEDPTLKCLPSQRQANQSTNGATFQQPQHHHAPQRQDTVICLDSIVLQPK
ncbi:unnamed protein product, partial [Mesorhabditis belari]|uniref:Uncharacterized protein n=1 Tax=Mesorhabditis belari TaxID=2138241 RepID=A0AAF3J5M4_9BILA